MLLTFQVAKAALSGLHLNLNNLVQTIAGWPGLTDDDKNLLQQICRLRFLGDPANMLSVNRQSAQQNVITAELCIHLMSVITSDQQASFFRQLFRNPSQFAGCFLPTMPGSVMEEIGGVQGITAFYVHDCGHIYGGKDTIISLQTIQLETVVSQWKMQYVHNVEEFLEVGITIL